MFAWAKDRVGNTDYQMRDPHELVGGRRGYWPLDGRTTPKCNMFVGDTYASAGVSLRRPENPDVYFVAEDFGNRHSEIPGFRPLSMKERLLPGDIISNGKHVAIYAPKKGKRATISAAVPLEGDAVVHNDWGFRGDEGPITVWRYAGVPAKMSEPNGGGGGW